MHPPQPTDDWSSWDASKARPEHEQTERYKNAPRSSTSRTSASHRNKSRSVMDLPMQWPDNASVKPSSQAAPAGFVSRLQHEQTSQKGNSQHTVFSRPSTSHQRSNHVPNGAVGASTAATLAENHPTHRYFPADPKTLRLSPPASYNIHATTFTPKDSGSIQDVTRSHMQTRQFSSFNHAAAAKGRWASTAACNQATHQSPDIHSEHHNASEAYSSHHSRFANLIPPSVIRNHTSHLNNILSGMTRDADTHATNHNSTSISQPAAAQATANDTRYKLHIPTEFKTDLPKRKQLQTFVSKLYSDGTLSLPPQHSEAVFPGQAHPHASLTLRGTGARQAATRLADFFIEHGSDMYFVLDPATRAALQNDTEPVQASATKDSPSAPNDDTVKLILRRPLPLVPVPIAPLAVAPPAIAPIDSDNGPIVPLGWDTHVPADTTAQSGDLQATAGGLGWETIGTAEVPRSAIATPAAEGWGSLPPRGQATNHETMHARPSHWAQSGSAATINPLNTKEVTQSSPSALSVRAVHWHLAADRSRGTVLGVRCCNLAWISRLSGMFISVEPTPTTLGTPRKITVTHFDRPSPAGQREEPDLMLAVRCLSAVGEMAQPGRFIPKLSDLPPALGIHSLLEIVDFETRAVIKEIVAAAPTYKPEHSNHDVSYTRLGNAEVLKLLRHLWMRYRPNLDFPLQAELDSEAGLQLSRASEVNLARTSIKSGSEPATTVLAGNAANEEHATGTESLHTFWQRFSAAAGEDHDGYITELQDEIDLYRKSVSKSTTYSERLAGVGSAVWALQNLADTIRACGFGFERQDFSDAKLGPSASQAGRSAESNSVDEAEVNTGKKVLANTQTWDIVGSAAVGDWVGKIKADAIAPLGSDALSDFDRVHTPEARIPDDSVPYIHRTTNPPIFSVPIPNNDVIRGRIIGARRCNLIDISIASCAVLELINNGRGPARVHIFGKPAHADKALLMLADLITKYDKIWADLVENSISARLQALSWSRAEQLPNLNRPNENTGVGLQGSRSPVEMMTIQEWSAYEGRKRYACYLARPQETVPLVRLALPQQSKDLTWKIGRTSKHMLEISGTQQAADNILREVVRLIAEVDPIYTPLGKVAERLGLQDVAIQSRAAHSRKTAEKDDGHLARCSSADDTDRPGHSQYGQSFSSSGWKPVGPVTDEKADDTVAQQLHMVVETGHTVRRQPIVAIPVSQGENHIDRSKSPPQVTLLHAAVERTLSHSLTSDLGGAIAMNGWDSVGSSGALAIPEAMCTRSNGYDSCSDSHQCFEIAP